MDLLFNLPRNYKRFISILADSLFIIIAFWAACFVRLDSTQIFTNTNNWLVILTVIPITLLANIKLGLYKAIIRYISTKAATSIMFAVIISTLALIICDFYYLSGLARTIPVIYATFLLLLFGGSRFFVRTYISQQNNKAKERVIIYGAGSSGRQLAQSLLIGNEYLPVAFLDDNPNLHKRLINNIPILAANDIDNTIKEYGAKRVLLAMPRERKKT